MSETTVVEQPEPEPSLNEAELAVLRELIAKRMQGQFVDMAEGRARTEAMIAAKRKAYGL
jgi:antitoxin ParD1/3/4